MDWELRLKEQRIIVQHIPATELNEWSVSSLPKTLGYFSASFKG